MSVHYPCACKVYCGDRLDRDNDGPSYEVCKFLPPCLERPLIEVVMVRRDTPPAGKIEERSEG